MPGDLACWVPGKAWSQTTGLISRPSNDTTLGLTQTRFILACCPGNWSCSPGTGSGRTSAWLGENTSPNLRSPPVHPPARCRAAMGWALHILSPHGRILLPGRGTYRRSLGCYGWAVPRALPPHLQEQCHLLPSAAPPPPHHHGAGSNVEGTELPRSWGLAPASSPTGAAGGDLLQAGAEPETVVCRAWSQCWPREW